MSVSLHNDIPSVIIAQQILFTPVGCKDVRGLMVCVFCSHVKAAALAALKGLQDRFGDELLSLLDACNIQPGQREDIELYLKPSAMSSDGQSAFEAASEASSDVSAGACLPHVSKMILQMQTHVYQVLVKVRFS